MSSVLKPLLPFLLLFSACLVNSTQTAQDPEPSVRFLKNIQTTFSISSNQYSEVVMDGHGNGYISCFYKYSDNADHIFIVKLDTLGKIKWVQGMDYKGRATCIAIDQRAYLGRRIL
ncbi:MAG: hypothetical protein R2784_15190 [Saprospiraceae bacterium]